METLHIHVLIPWWGWLILYLIHVGLSAAYLRHATGRRENEDWRELVNNDAMLAFCLMCIVGFLIVPVYATYRLGFSWVPQKFALWNSKLHVWRIRRRAIKAKQSSVYRQTPQDTF